MKFLRTSWTLVLLLAFLPVISPAEQQHKSINLDQKATIGDHQLKPGLYELRWDDSQKNTTVQFQRDGKAVATAPARVIRKSDRENATYEINTANGQNRLDRVYFSHEQLAFGNAAQANSSATSKPTAPPTQ
jgi:hypothetical protein